MNFVSLTTDRLLLQPPTFGDAPQVFAIAGDPRTVLHNPSDLLVGLEAAEDLVRRWHRHWSDHGFGYWCVREHEKPAMIGYCGLKTTTVQGMSMLNLIYRFAPEFWNRGFASECAVAVVSWGSERLRGAPIIARIRPGNFASQHVARKGGLVRDAALDSQGEDGPDLAFTNRAALGISDARSPAHP